MDEIAYFLQIFNKNALKREKGHFDNCCNVFTYKKKKT